MIPCDLINLAPLDGATMYYKSSNVRCGTGRSYYYRPTVAPNYYTESLMGLGPALGKMDLHIEMTVLPKLAFYY